MKKITVTDFYNKKLSGEKITMLTAYDYPTAKILDDSNVDSILVGDSLGMVVLGYEDTTKVTMEDMIHHIKAVARGTKRAMIIGDMPFLSYHTGVIEAVRNAGRLVSEGGCHAVKLEGGTNVAMQVEAIVSAGIPVVGHVGFTPQSVLALGGHKAQGKTFDSALKVLTDAMAIEKAGAFCVVLECVPEKIAKIVSSKLKIPTIGIGSGIYCDGQVLVTSDMLGLFDDFNPKHVKKYFNLSEKISEVAKMFINEVCEGIFPEEKNSFKVDDKVVQKLKEYVLDV